MNQQPSIKKRRAGTPAFWILIAVGAVIAVFVLAILVDSAAYHNKVHAGISVAGVDLGGQSKDEAIASVNRLVDQARNSPITLTAGDKSWELMADDAGTSMDVKGAVSAALAVTREKSFFSDLRTRWKLYFNKQDLPLTGTVDSAKMDSFVAGIANEIDIIPVNAGLAIESGKIKVIEGLNGHVVDQASLAEHLSALLVTLHSTTVEVPIVVQEPDVQADDNQAAQQQAETMISDTVTVAYGDKSWTITPDEIASSMGFRSEMKNGVSTLVPFMDTTKLQPILDTIAPDVVKEPTNASFDSDGSKAWVVPGKNGEQLDAEATAQAITDATLDPTGRTVKVVVKAKEPDRTTEEAKAMGVKEVLASYSTTYSCPTPRQINVKLATKYSTDVLLAPGQGYDFDKQIGRRTAARGWQLAPGIVGPNQLEDVLGGGICQVSTTMFNAVGNAGLKVTERQNHSLYISHYPKGRDATVTAGGKNLRFVNDTGHYIWIRGTSTGIKTTITIYGTDDGRKGHVTWTVGDFYDVVPQNTVKINDPSMLTGKSTVSDKGQQGKSLKTTRVVTRNGVVIHKDVWTSRWPMYPVTVLVGTGTTSTTAPPTTAPPTTAPPTTAPPST